MVINEKPQVPVRGSSGVHEVESLGPFEVSVAESTGRVWIGAYRDLNQNNRPNQGEPFGWYARNPVYLDDPPDSIEINLVVVGKSQGLGVDFREWIGIVIPTRGQSDLLQAAVEICIRCAGAGGG